MQDEVRLEITYSIESIWNEVFKISNTVIRDFSKFGYHGLEVIPNPNIHQMLLSIKLVHSYLDVLIDVGENGELGIGYDEVRKMLNSQQQLNLLQELATALKADNRVDFDETLEKIKAQCVF